MAVVALLAVECLSMIDTGDVISITMVTNTGGSRGLVVKVLDSKFKGCEFVFKA